MSNLAEKHRSAGAVMGEAGGKEFPKVYGEPVAEFRAAGEGVALFDLSLRGKVEVTGPDAVPFLNGIVSADVEGLEAGCWCFAAILDTRGRYRADLRIFRLKDRILLDTPPFAKQDVLQMLLEMRLRSRAQIRDLTDELALLSLQGPRARVVWRNAGLGDAPGEGGVLELPDPPVAVAGYSETPAGGLWVHLPATRAVALWDALVAAGAAPCGLETLRVLRIEAGVPAWGVDIDPAVIPIEAGQKRALCFSKCYPGQEVVSRIHFRGHVNRYLQILRVPSGEIPPPGARILSGGREVGAVTSSGRNAWTGEAYALGYVRRQTLLQKDPLEVVWEGGTTAVNAEPLPYSPVE